MGKRDAEWGRFGLLKAGDDSPREDGGLLLVKEDVSKGGVPAEDDSTSRNDWNSASVVAGDTLLSSLNLGLCE